jgi:hypothetical protein
VYGVGLRVRLQGALCKVWVQGVGVQVSKSGIIEHDGFS